MKHLSTTLVSKGLATKSIIVATAVLAAIAIPVQMSQTVFADKYDDQIAAIQRQINSYQGESSRLAQKSDTLERKVAILQNQQNSIQAQLDKSEARYNQLVKDIAANEKKIAENREGLGETLADIYVDDSISPLEMLASSDNIGDYVDKQEYRSSIRDNLTQTIENIKQLKKKLEKQKAEVTNVISDQKSQRSTLIAKKNERAKLLADTRGKESAYQKLISKGKSAQNDLASQQRAAIAERLAQTGVSGQASAGDPGRGGYPNNLYNAPLDALVDPWGMYNRECVSYTAWKVYQKRGHMPYWGGNGHAFQWPGMADGASISRGSTPRVGSVGVMSASPYGHVVWVESINANGTINISQMNEQVTGEYSERYNVNPATYYTYIYF